jgi:2-oxo-3-hexenedioate decarboxylase
MNEQRNEASGQIIGLSLGPSSANEQQMLTTPTIDWLTDDMALGAGLPVPADLSDARVAPALVFLLGKELTGPGANAATALAAVDSVYAGIEVVDGLTKDRHSATPDATAVTAATKRFVIGPVGRRPEGLDLSLEACLLEVDGEVFDSATGAEAYGHPAEALALAANTAAAQEVLLQPGWLVFTGGLTGAISIGPAATVAVSFTNLGCITLGAT